jgi:hypothetical protein
MSKVDDWEGTSERKKEETKLKEKHLKDRKIRK